MGTEVANARSNALAAIKGLKGKLAKVREELPVTGGKGYLKFGKDGNWSYGVEGKDANGITVAINPLATKTGYQCWTDYPDSARKKNELLKELLYPFGADKPSVHELEDLGWDWRECVQFQLKIVGGKDDGKELTFLTSSKGGLGMAKAYFDALDVQIDEDPEHPVALVALGNGHYPHTQWGKTYFPDFDIVGWLSMDGEPADDEEEEEEPQEAPVRSRRAAQPVEIEEVDEVEEIDEELYEEEEPEEATPVRRRRR